MPFKFKAAAAGLVLACIVLASWTNSDGLYGFYLRAWYKTIRGETAAGSVEHAEKLRKEYEAAISRTVKKSEQKELKKHFDEQLGSYLGMMSRVWDAEYRTSDDMPADIKEFFRYAGIRYIEQGDVVKGAHTLLRTVGSPVGREDIIPFTLAIGAMYNTGLYSDIAAETADRAFDASDERYAPRVNVYFWYGASLYHLKRYKEALIQLRSAEVSGYSGDDGDYYTAACYYELKQYRDGIVYAKKALEADRRSRRNRSLLVSLYNADGQKIEAEKVTRVK